MFTEEQVKKYIDSGGVNCPFCDSPDILGGSFDMEAGMVSQNIICMSCKKEWTDEYKLIDIWTLEKDGQGQEPSKQP